ncbi:DgyrCDS10706 [Dimorphilus gyrociliatus]|uniref:DgyrCDS10706 n=1 Tax=Dimorphilus gyrociliatus TaxID=2664684 RepID=A0A7I8W111_9ANNE|nr:DgyrCDS10706 [Dimorphilus gyrociliatus]
MYYTNKDSTYGTQSTPSSNNSGSKIYHNSISSLEDRSKSSGRSSDNVNTLEKKFFRKKLMKKCIKQLKTFVPLNKTRGRTDTLSALKHAVNYMNKLKDNQLNANEERMEDKLSSCGLKLPIDAKQKWYKLVLSDTDMTLLEAPEALLNRILNYPRNFLIRKPFVQILHSNDKCTISTCYSNCIDARSKDEAKQREEDKLYPFYFRLKKFDLASFASKQDDFSVFSGVMYPTTDDNSNTQSNDWINDNEKTYTLECSPVVSSYTNGFSPNESKFMTRHTVHLTINFLHPLAVGLTGFLPQDIIGTSILDHFRSSDWNSIKDSFEHVLTTGHRSKTKIYKFRIKNGSFITTKIEWSPVYNIWSKKLDFIAGKYTVIGEPENKNIFSDNSNLIKHSTAEKELQSTVRRHIFELYLNTSSTSGSSTFFETSEFYSTSQKTSSENQFIVETSESENNDETKKTVDDIKASSLIYKQLNYYEMLNKFLKLLPDTNISLPNDNPYDKGSGVKVDITLNVPLHKPPSFASSTKAFIEASDQEEVICPPSPIIEDDYKSYMTEDALNKPVNLTRSVLKVHNKRSEQRFVESMMNGISNDLMITKNGTFHIKSTKGRISKRRISDSINSSETPFKPKRMRDFEGDYTSERDNARDKLSRNKHFNNVENRERDLEVLERIVNCLAAENSKEATNGKLDDVFSLHLAYFKAFRSKRLAEETNCFENKRGLTDDSYLYDRCSKGELLYTREMHSTWSSDCNSNLKYEVRPQIENNNSLEPIYQPSPLKKQFIELLNDNKACSIGSEMSKVCSASCSKFTLKSVSNNNISEDDSDSKCNVDDKKTNERDEEAVSNELIINLAKHKETNSESSSEGERGKCSSDMTSSDNRSQEGSSSSMKESDNQVETLRCTTKRLVKTKSDSHLSKLVETRSENSSSSSSNDWLNGIFTDLHIRR